MIVSPCELCFLSAQLLLLPGKESIERSIEDGELPDTWIKEARV